MHLITMLATLLSYHPKACTDLNTLHGVNTHHHMGNIRIQFIKERLSQANWNFTRTHFNLCSTGVPCFTQLIHVFLELGNDLGIGSKKWVLPNLRYILKRYRHLTQLTHVRHNLGAIVFTQPFFSNSSSSHNGRC